ncbi:hypothetical protein FOTG_18101 [Fusarium oxysporum f. sp. vasinfectum 25433]|uniref:Uncharacterized protein n=1 Tax=Fusarium oxysporum f. sp. vasinfectum 25433 TaxID=1089449 RepID=X0KXP8_FUSOX|nr:hypothetical protein FOTG_18101 [Fusarium oxysporum f. sp. vasinfectum 25433]
MARAMGLVAAQLRRLRISSTVLSTAQVTYTDSSSITKGRITRIIIFSTNLFTFSRPNP